MNIWSWKSKITTRRQAALAAGGLAIVITILFLAVTSVAFTVIF